MSDLTQDDVLKWCKERGFALVSFDVLNRPKGEWIDMGDFEQCSVCEGTHLKEFETRYGKALWVKSKYCQNCGAEMRGVKELTERMKALAENAGHALGIMSKQVDDLTQKVELLSDLPSAQPEHLVKESSDLVKDLVNDCISRQSALDILDDFQSNIELGIDDYEEKRKALCDLPSADRPQGEWISNHDGSWNCSECGLRVFACAKVYYCPNCGADMRGEQDE